MTLTVCPYVDFLRYEDYTLPKEFLSFVLKL